MDIKRSGSQPSGKEPAEHFTGNVRIDPLFQTTDPARALGVSVTFEPGGDVEMVIEVLGGADRDRTDDLPSKIQFSRLDICGHLQTQYLEPSGLVSIRLASLN